MNKNNDTISRQSAIQAAECIVDHHAITPYQTMRSAMDHLQRILRGMPSAQPRRIRGYWKPYTMSEITGYDPTLSGHDPVGVYCCSVCGCDAYLGDDGQDLLTDFCPNCGADRGRKRTMVQIDMDKPARCIDCPLCVDYDCIIQTRLLRENYDDLREQYKNCPLIPETVTGCNDCPEYDTEKHYCEKFCRVIRNTVEELRHGTAD